jgi:hypothetical protein
MIRSLIVLGAILLSTIEPALAASVPPQIARMAEATARVTSYHIDMTTQTGAIAVDVVGSSDFHMFAPTAEILHVGKAFYDKPSPASGWIRLPADQETAVSQTISQLVQNPDVFANVPADAEITDLGSEALDGRPMHRYRFTHPASDGPVTTLWIGEDDRLYRVDIAGKAGTATIRYSHYNDVGRLPMPL